MSPSEATARGRWSALRATALALATLTVAATGATGATVALDATPPPQVGDLTAEHLSSPLGIDAARPLLGWQLDSDARGARQRAYRILVATSPTDSSPARPTSGTAARSSPGAPSTRPTTAPR